MTGNGFWTLLTKGLHHHRQTLLILASTALFIAAAGATGYVLLHIGLQH